ITVVLLDDRVAAVLGEAVAGVARGFRYIVSLIIGSGVGLGMIFDNKPYTGSFNVSGAIGWWLLNKEVVGETKKGFLEEELAGPYIEVEMKNLCRSYPEKCRYILYLSKGSIENITSEIIFRAYDEGDILTKTILTRKATILAITIANIISLLAPDIVVLNGTIGVELGKRFSGLLKSVVSEIINPYMRQYINITISELGFKANLIGAASYLIRKTQIL
ncbi:MAG: ROK family protein, partial [Sulfolobales archaeon]